MNTFHNILMALGVAVLLGGCAHPITMAPDLAKLAQDDTHPKIDKSVGYFISEKNRVLRVTTPGGGGDSVEYAPYADLEPGLHRVLSNVFSTVHVVSNMDDVDFLRNKNIAWVFTPTVATTSSSRNAFFWPPTDFSITIDCIATDSAIQQVWKTTINTDGGLIPVKEILKDHGLAGKSAAEKALVELQSQLRSASQFR